MRHSIMVGTVIKKSNPKVALSVLEGEKQNLRYICVTDS